MDEYVIIGDTKEYEGCLVCLCGITYENAEKTLNRMLNKPNTNDKRLMDGMTNFRIKKVDAKNCWWNYGCD